MDLNLIYYAFVELYLTTRRSTGGVGGGGEDMSWTLSGIWVNGI